MIRLTFSGHPVSECAEVDSDMCSCKQVCDKFQTFGVRNRF